MNNQEQRGVRYQDLQRFRIPRGFRGRGALFVQLWWLVQSTLFRGSPQIFYGWRRFLLRLFGAKIGANVLVRSSVEITYPWKVTIGDHSWIGDDVVIYSLGPIEIGSNTVISQRSYLCAGSHRHDVLSFDIVAAPLRIGDECWIATDVFVAPGVSIGHGSVVGARSTVLGDLPAGMICYGSPAQATHERHLSVADAGERRK